VGHPRSTHTKSLSPFYYTPPAGFTPPPRGRTPLPHPQSETKPPSATPQELSRHVYPHRAPHSAPTHTPTYLSHAPTPTGVGAHPEVHLHPPGATPEGPPSPSNTQKRGTAPPKNAQSRTALCTGRPPALEIQPLSPRKILHCTALGTAVCSALLLAVQ